MMYKLVSTANSLIEQPNYFYYIVYVDKKEQWTKDRTLRDTSQDGKPLRVLSVNDNELFSSSQIAGEPPSYNF